MLKPEFIQSNISIAESTYYKMGGIARYFALPRNIAEVQETLSFCKKHLLPCAILGSGSNSVYADGVFEGLILSLEKLNRWHWENENYLFVEAGVTNTEVAEICAAYNRAGASWMYRMPGQIGGTVRMNARCYGGEISQIAKEILTLNQHGELITYRATDVFHGYKKTLLMDSPHIVLAVRLFFPQKESAEKLIQHMHECEADRHSKQHFYLPSCGSTFKNNYSLGKPSGKVFDELGLKGKRFGEAAVSEFHANFIWNFGHAKTIDMLQLTAHMRSCAKNVFNADLELEVQPVGVFPEKLYIECGMENLGPSYLSAGQSSHNCQEENKKWVGLFYFPYASNKASVIFPKLVFSSPFVEYNQSPFSGVPEIFVKIVQLQLLENARKNPSTQFLKWETQCFGDPSALFPLQVPKKNKKDLWHYSVSEIFFAHAINSSNYLEFELTPKKDWIALKFSDVRKQHPEVYTPNLQTYSSADQCFSFGIIFSYTNLSYILHEKDEILMQCALSLGNERYLLAPYWKKEKDEKADFHQPTKFWKIIMQ